MGGELSWQTFTSSPSSKITPTTSNCPSSTAVWSGALPARRGARASGTTTSSIWSSRARGPLRSAARPSPWPPEPPVLARQRERYAAALTEFERYYGPGRQVHLYSAPGRAELGGNHTDHQHGYGPSAWILSIFGSCGSAKSAKMTPPTALVSWSSRPLGLPK